jgi:hypothetical protein
VHFSYQTDDESLSFIVSSYILRKSSRIIDYRLEKVVHLLVDLKGQADERLQTGLSVSLVVLWLAGDFFNATGSLMAALQPTVILLAIYVSSSPYFLKDLRKDPFSTHFAIPSYSSRYTIIDGKTTEKRTDSWKPR